ncbi:MAG: recombinase family protein [Candidatus Thermoplasmatota archaeon]|nr:recombinase family protein [Candidatus Thermoplasmatota archaeon]
MTREYKVAFYVRVSREEQAKGYSPEGQRSTLDTWAKEMGWKWVKTYQDEVSGKDTKRERFQEMIADAKHGLFEGICMLDNDRFSRSTKDLLNVMDDLLAYGVKLHIYNLRHIDIYSDQGRFILTNFAAFSEFFRGQLASKIRVGVRQKMKKEWFGQAPYGYKVVSDLIGTRRTNTRLVENEEEQGVIRLMKKLREESRSYSEIAATLNEKKIPTRLKRAGRKCKWHPITVRNILRMIGGAKVEKEA